MKILFLFCVFTIAAYARIGETPDEIQKRFGKPDHNLGWLEMQRLLPGYKLTTKDAAISYVFEETPIVVHFLNNRSVFEKYVFNKDGTKLSALKEIEDKVLELHNNGDPWVLEFTKIPETDGALETAKYDIKQHGLLWSGITHLREYRAFYKAKGFIVTFDIQDFKSISLVIETDDFRALRLSKTAKEIPAVKPALPQTPLAGFAKEIPAVKPAQTVAESQKQAVAKYPELAKQGSALHTQFLDLLKQAKDAKEPLLDDPNWPMILADKVSDQIAKERQPAIAPKPPEVAPIDPDVAASLDKSKSRLGETLPQCVARYGPVTQKLTVSKFPQFVFQKDKVQITVTFVDGKAQQITYKKQYFLAEEVQKLLELSAAGSRWELDASKTALEQSPNFDVVEMFLRKDEGANAEHFRLKITASSLGMEIMDTVTIQAREFHEAIKAGVLKGL